MTLRITIHERARRAATVVILEAHCADGALVGRVVLECRGPTVYLENIWIDPRERGKGHGDELLEHARVEAARRGGVVLQCDPIAYEEDLPGAKLAAPAEEQQQLRAWYRRRGFAALEDEDGALWECKLVTQS